MKFEKWVVYASAWQHTEKESAPVPSPIEHEAIPVEATAPVEVTAPAEPAAPEEGSQTRYMLRKRKSVHFEDEAVYAGEMEPTGADGKEQRVTYQKPTGYDEDDDEPDVKPKVESFDDYEAIHGKLEMEPVAEESDAKMKMEPGSDEDAMDTT
ncbi:unnamed protein product [Zymoseptoria tritici ST99CH_3D1]|nr:unnamed protein product [Zymoseptoria tritici ST99CH_3D1]